MTNRNLFISLCVAIFFVVAPTHVFAFEPVGGLTTPVQAPGHTPVWQEFIAEPGDIFWPHIISYMLETGIADKQSARSVFDTLEAVQSTGVVFGKIDRNGYPTALAGTAYLLPVPQKGWATNAPSPLTNGDLDEFFKKQELQGEKIGEIKEDLLHLQQQSDTNTKEIGKLKDFFKEDSGIDQRIREVVKEIVPMTTASTTPFWTWLLLALILLIFILALWLWVKISKKKTGLAAAHTKADQALSRIYEVRAGLEAMVEIDAKGRLSAPEFTNEALRNLGDEPFVLRMPGTGVARKQVHVYNRGDYLELRGLETGHDRVDKIDTIAVYRHLNKAMAGDNNWVIGITAAKAA